MQLSGCFADGSSVFNEVVQRGDIDRDRVTAGQGQSVEKLQSWLPPSAWEDQKMRPYVPSTYAICLSNSTGMFVDQPPIRPSRI